MKASAIHAWAALFALAEFTKGSYGATSSPGQEQGANSTDRAAQNGSQAEQKKSESLSEKLDRQKGVIKPKRDVDPLINKPAPVPNPNSTPVIPPPGSPGGPPGPEPK